MKRYLVCLTRHGNTYNKRVFNNIRCFFSCERGEFSFEATVLLPFCFMVLFALILLSMYLPQRAYLQRATQVAANALAVDQGDTSLSFDEGTFTYVRSSRWVYSAILNDVDRAKAERIVFREWERTPVRLRNVNLTVDTEMTNFILYREIMVTATLNIPVPVNFSFVRFPRTMDITVSSSAVVADGDEFIRNVDMVVDMANWMAERFGISGDALRRVPEFFDSFLGLR